MPLSPSPCPLRWDRSLRRPPAQEHVHAHPRALRLREPAHRRPGESGDAGALRGRAGDVSTAIPHRAGTGGVRSASGLPEHALRGGFRPRTEGQPREFSITAHIAACLADNGWPRDGGPVIGVALDGTTAMTARSGAASGFWDYTWLRRAPCRCPSPRRCGDARALAHQSPISMPLLESRRISLPTPVSRASRPGEAGFHSAADREGPECAPDYLDGDGSSTP